MTDRPETGSRPARRSIAYRSDIDGLRAISIIGVVLFHASMFQPAFGAFSGGFVGVDVFFVISGYLITAIILRELGEGRFSLGSFYERRIRRIFPALFAMLAATAAVASIVMLPKEIRAFAPTLAAAAGFVTNYVLAAGDGYFVTTLTSRPLLHLWSLAIEEQFYIVFPLLLVAIVRLCPGRLKLVITGLTVAFFILNLWLVTFGPPAFFWTQARAWELLIGAVLACRVIPPLRNRHARAALAWLGLALLIAAMALFHEGMPWPGAGALLPCLGAAFVIHAGEGGSGLAGRLLSWRPMVATGLLSYSLYVWHWPVLAVTQSYILTRPLSVLDTILLLLLSVGVAVLSRRYLEQPFLGKSGLFTRRGVFAAGTASAVVVALFALMLVRTDGWPQRLPREVAAIAAVAREGRGSPCVRSTAAELNASPCFIGLPGKPPTFAVWGDSHGDAMISAISDLAAARGVAGEAMVMRGCAPLLGGPVLPPYTGVPESFEKVCVPFREAAFARIAANPSIRTVILIARWSIHSDLTGFGAADRERIAPFRHQGWFRDARRAARESFATAVPQTIAALEAAGKKVVILLSIPEARQPVPEAMARASLTGAPLTVAARRQDFLEYTVFPRQVLERAALEQGVTLVDPATVLCPDERCRIGEAGRPFYFDDDHLSRFGAEQVAPLLAPAIAGPAAEGGSP